MPSCHPAPTPLTLVSTRSCHRFGCWPPTCSSQVTPHPRDHHRTAPAAAGPRPQATSPRLGGSLSAPAAFTSPLPTQHSHAGMKTLHSPARGHSAPARTRAHTRPSPLVRCTRSGGGLGTWVSSPRNHHLLPQMPTAPSPGPTSPRPFSGALCTPLPRPTPHPLKLSPRPSCQQALPVLSSTRFPAASHWPPTGLPSPGPEGGSASSFCLLQLPDHSEICCVTLNSTTVAICTPPVSPLPSWLPATPRNAMSDDPFQALHSLCWHPASIAQPQSHLVTATDEPPVSTPAAPAPTTGVRLSHAVPTGACTRQERWRSQPRARRRQQPAILPFLPGPRAHGPSPRPLPAPSQEPAGPTGETPTYERPVPGSS